MADEQQNTSPHIAEQAVLASLMSTPDYWDEVSGQITSHDFSARQHRVIFHAMELAALQNRPTDFVTVIEMLRQNEELDKIGGEGFLRELCDAYASAINLMSYVAIVREAAILRSLAQAGKEIYDSARKPEGSSTTELLDEAEMKVFSIKNQLLNDKSEGLILVKHDLPATLAYLHELSLRGGSITGISTGFTELDLQTTGMHEGDLIILAARPGMGKTTLAMNIAESVAVHQNLPVAVFSLEMPRRQIIMRMLSSLGQVNQKELQQGKMESEINRSRLQMGISQLQKAPLFIDDNSSLNIADIRARVRRLKSQFNCQRLGLVVVDYIQLMQMVGRAQDTRSSMIGDISRALKIMAKEMEVPVLALSQLSRAVESREDRRPMLSDLRESGAIEQDADLVMFVYRDVVYNRNTERKDAANIIIAKQRNGPSPVEVNLRFEGPFFRFASLTGQSSMDIDNYEQS